MLAYSVKVVFVRACVLLCVRGLKVKEVRKVGWKPAESLLVTRLFGKSTNRRAFSICRESAEAAEIIVDIS